MRIGNASLALVVLTTAAFAAAQDYRIEEVRSLAATPITQLKLKTIAFSELKGDEAGDAPVALMKFEDWARVRPVQKQFLSLYPSYAERTVQVTTNGTAKAVKERMHVYVAEARFMVARPAATISLARYTTTQFLERIDQAIKHQPLAPAEAMPRKSAEAAHNRNPDHAWCEGMAPGICIQSRYKFEGKLPAGIQLANKLREQGRRPIVDFIEFQSELRVMSADELKAIETAKLTSVDAPVQAALVQNIFWVNQIMQFGKLLAILQQHPTDPGKTIVSAYIVLAVKSDVLEKQKGYENVPVLRNLVPAQVLLGNSSFNTGNSISAGLPKYARNRVQAIADIMERE